MMTLLSSAPATVSVTSFPYSLPNNPGDVVLIGTNFAQDVRPPGWSPFQWNYAIFDYYGGGTFVADYSIGGAYAVAGSGGHLVPPNVGACLFDFADATWKRVDNSNGVAWRTTDYATSEIYSDGTGELIAAPIRGIPAPGHLYGSPTTLPAALGGGAKGSVLLGTTNWQGNGSPGYAFAFWSHAMNLQTGLWTRLSTNSIRNPYATQSPGFNNDGLPFSMSYDAATNRYYGTPNTMFRMGGALDYLDAADWTWKRQTITNFNERGEYARNNFLDATRHILVLATSYGTLRAINLSNPTNFVNLSFSGGAIWDDQNKFAFYPPDGCWYSMNAGSTSTLIKLTPPPANPNPFAGTWTFSTVSLSEALPIVDQTQLNQGGVRHHTRLFYVPSIQRLAWIAGGSNKVAILKP